MKEHQLKKLQALSGDLDALIARETSLDERYQNSPAHLVDLEHKREIDEQIAKISAEITAAKLQHEKMQDIESIEILMLRLDDLFRELQKLRALPPQFANKKTALEKAFKGLSVAKKMAKARYERLDDHSENFASYLAHRVSLLERYEHNGLTESRLQEMVDENRVYEKMGFIPLQKLSFPTAVQLFLNAEELTVLRERLEDRTPMASDFTADQRARLLIPENQAALKTLFRVERGYEAYLPAALRLEKVNTELDLVHEGYQKLLASAEQLANFAKAAKTYYDDWASLEEQSTIITATADKLGFRPSSERSTKEAATIFEVETAIAQNTFMPAIEPRCKRTVMRDDKGIAVTWRAPTPEIVAKTSLLFRQQEKESLQQKIDDLKAQLLEPGLSEAVEIETDLFKLELLNKRFNPCRVEIELAARGESQRYTIANKASFNASENQVAMVVAHLQAGYTTIVLAMDNNVRITFVAGDENKIRLSPSIAGKPGAFFESKKQNDTDTGIPAPIPPLSFHG